MPSSAVKEKKTGSGKGIGAVLVLCILAVSCALGLFLFRSQSHPPASTPSPIPTATSTSPPADTEPPVIEGLHDMTVAVGMTLSYRSGVTAVDKVDGKVKLEVDASAVNLLEPGKYPVIYRAADRAGNRAETSVTVTVVAVAGVNDDDPTADVSGEEPETEPLPIKEVTPQMVDEEADRILDKILSPSMSQWEQARAIYNYVHTHVKYVGSSDKSNWLIGAYVGFTRGRGDCYNYFACSKALLTRAGIPNVDLERVGGSTDHYWQLVNVGSGWYHFDACPHPDSYPLGSFLLDEMAVRAYTEKCAPVRSNYYVYDYANCPVTAVGFPAEERPTESGSPVESSPPQESELPPEDGEILLPPGILADPTPTGQPQENPGTEESPLPPAETVGAEATAEPVPEPSQEPTPVETQSPETPPPSTPETDPPAAETPAEFIEATGKEEVP